MRILVVTPTYLPIVGGAEIGIYEIYRRLGARHEVRVFTPRVASKISSRDTLPAELPTPLEVVRFRDHWSLFNIPGKRLTLGVIPPFSLAQVFLLRRQIREFSPDVINLHYAVPGGLAAVVNRKLLGVPVVLSLVGRDVPGSGTPPMWRYYIRAVAAGCDAVVCISDYSRRCLFGPAWPEKVSVIPYGVSLNRFALPADRAAIRSELGLPADHTVLLAVQRLAVQKRVDVIIRAASVLAADDTKFFLGVVGTGPCNDELIRLAASERLNGRVRFFGEVPEADLTALYQASDIFIFHSTYETFGVVLIEAMAAGLPVVSVHTTAIPELVEHEKNGLLVPPLDHVAMADAARRLIADTQMRSELGRCARQTASAYDWESVANQYEAVLHETVTGCWKK